MLRFYDHIKIKLKSNNIWFQTASDVFAKLNFEYRVKTPRVMNQSYSFLIRIFSIAIMRCYNDNNNNIDTRWTEPPGILANGNRSCAEVSRTLWTIR